MHGPARYSRHAWLAALLPASAVRLRVDDQELAATLALAGAELVTGDDADVELASAAERVTAEHVIVTIDHGPRGAQRNDSEPLPVKIARHLSAFAATRAEARRARVTLARSGFSTRSYVWDFEQPLRPVGANRQVRSIERFPKGALVVGARGTPPPSTLDTILAEAAEAALVPPGGTVWSLPRVQESRLVVLGRHGVLRVSIGPGAQTIVAQERRLSELRSLPLSPVVAGRLPAILASGRTGLARWTLEQRLPGHQPAPPLANSLLEQCLELLVELHAVRSREARDLRAAAAIVAGASDAGEAVAVRLLGERLRERLREVRRGFGHGDFWRGNLLVHNHNLSGVIDWEDASVGQLPLVDLLHLELTADQSIPLERWGPTIINRLLPAARAGGSELVRAYCERVGLTASPTLLIDLTFAYWLERVALELGSFVDRRLRRVWMEQNVVRVIRAAAAMGV